VNRTRTSIVNGTGNVISNSVITNSVFTTCDQDGDQAVIIGGQVITDEDDD
jgi:hypothetical protein